MAEKETSMTLDQFLAMENPEKYDFTNDGASEEYRSIIELEKKFFVYMAIKHSYKRSDASIMKKGADFSQECKKTYGHIPDPDSESELLRRIYHRLWSKDILSLCQIEGGGIQGETANSNNTTLNICYTKCKETSDQQIERMSLSPRQRVSIKYILSRYVEATSTGVNLFGDFPAQRNFLALYHTLGNFLPVPTGCNSPRGTGKTKDYWDLALKIIFDYYTNKIDNIASIVGTEEKLVCKYKEWLDAFGSWENFVEKNYLQDFVNISYDGKYKEPKELWKKHFSKEILPMNEEINQFYTNASSWILARGNRMIIALQEVVKEHEKLDDNSTQANDQ